MGREEHPRPGKEIMMSNPVPEWKKNLYAARCEIGRRRAIKEIARRGYTAPDPTRHYAWGTVLESITAKTPGFLPGFEASVKEGVAYFGASWTGDWEAWGWNADGQYWSVERKVSKADAQKASAIVATT